MMVVTTTTTTAAAGTSIHHSMQKEDQQNKKNNNNIKAPIELRFYISTGQAIRFGYILILLHLVWVFHTPI